jgi:hypothetical protein
VRLREWPTGPFTKPCGDPSIATPPFFFFEALNFHEKKKIIKKTGAVNYTAQNTPLSHVY